MSFFRCRSLFVLLLMFWFHTCGILPSAIAQEDESKEEEKKVLDEALLLLKKQLKSPRQTVMTFLEAMENQDFELAARCFDLSGLDAETAAAKQKTYAVKLHLIINKLDPNFNPELLSDDSGVEAPVSVMELEGTQPIQLVPDAEGLWRFAPSTLEQIDSDAFDHLLASNQMTEAESGEAALSFPLWLQQQFDESWWQTTFLIKDYQWVCLVILLLAGLAIGHLSKWGFNYLTLLWFRFTNTEVDEATRKKLSTPVVTLIHIWVWYQGTTLIDLPSSVMGIILPILKFLTVLAAVWTAFRSIDVLKNYLLKRARGTASRYDDSIVPFLSSGLKLLSIVLGIMLFVDIFDKDWMTVLGGFGVVGIAVAIASKDMLGNFFGSITVLTDRPFEIGDWVVIDGQVEGTVEHVGIRSSRIRTFHDSEIIVPNSLLTTAIVDNMGRRHYRRFKSMLQVRYDTPVTSLEAFCAGIRQLIQKNPYAVNAPHVYVHQFGEHSIDILLYMFFDAGDWTTELRERHCLMTDILRLAEGLGVAFAFPTRTIELESANGFGEIAGNGDGNGQKSADRIGGTIDVDRARKLADEIHRVRRDSQ